MKHRNIQFIFIAVLLTGCTSFSEITPAGKDTFMIAGSDPWEAKAGVNIKSDLYRKANAYCDTIGKKFMPRSDSSTNYSAELTFRCLSENDPEFDRPNMQPVPDVRIVPK